MLWLSICNQKWNTLSFSRSQYFRKHASAYWIECNRMSCSYGPNGKETTWKRKLAAAWLTGSRPRLHLQMMLSNIQLVRPIVDSGLPDSTSIPAKAGLWCNSELLNAKLSRCEVPWGPGLLAAQQEVDLWNMQGSSRQGVFPKLGE